MGFIKKIIRMPSYWVAVFSYVFFMNLFSGFNANVYDNLGNLNNLYFGSGIFGYEFGLVLSGCILIGVLFFFLKRNKV